MPTSDPDSEDVTSEPSAQRYDRYRFEQTTDGEALIYDVERRGCWLQAEEALALDDWR